VNLVAIKKVKSTYGQGTWRDFLKRVVDTVLLVVWAREVMEDPQGWAVIVKGVVAKILSKHYFAIKN